MDFDGIIACGDSYTHGSGKTKIPEPQCWPHVLGNRLDLPVENLSRGGASNTEIANQLFKCNYTYKKPLIIFAFTIMQRIPFYTKHGFLHSTYGIDDIIFENMSKQMPDERIELAKKFFQLYALDYNNLSGLEHLTIKAIEQVNAYKKLMPHATILWGQVHSDNVASKIFSENVRNSTLNHLGSCFNKSIDMLPIDSLLEQKHRQLPEDLHPNGGGMEYIADFFYSILDK